MSGTYAGEVDAENKAHGRGKYTYTTGAVYIGEWSHGARHGYGKYTFPSGYTHEGLYENDHTVGHGACSWRSGESYTGEFLKGLISTGVMTRNNKLYDISCVLESSEGLTYVYKATLTSRDDSSVQHFILKDSRWYLTGGLEWSDDPDSHDTSSLFSPSSSSAILMKRRAAARPDMKGPKVTTTDNVTTSNAASTTSNSYSDENSKTVSSDHKVLKKVNKTSILLLITHVSTHLLIVSTHARCIISNL
jgi:hypothetical protein